jgi:hypothetical protein
MGNGSIDNISLQRLVKNDERRLLYVFDIRNDRAICLDFIEEDEASLRKVYPQTVEEKGIAPDQFNTKSIGDDDESTFSDTEEEEIGYEL